MLSLLTHVVFEYHLVIDILHGRQHGSDFMTINPNAKIPAMIDQSRDNKEITLFESGSILLYLAQTFNNQFLPVDNKQRAICMNWVFWQTSGFGPVAGQLWHFLNYAPTSKAEAKDYGIARYGMELQRLCAVLEQRLQANEFVGGEDYSIADMMIFPWIHLLNSKVKHSSGVVVSDFLSMEKYHHIKRWESRILEREAVQRGLQVCSFTGVSKPWVRKSSSNNP